MSHGGPHGGLVLNVGEGKQLFLDDDFLVENKIRVRPVMHQPVKEGYPVLLPDRPWEVGGFHTGTVMFEEGVFKMWYGGLDESLKTTCFCFARSVDGTTWEKPSLGIHERDGSSENNIVMVLEGDEENLGTACVFRDPRDERAPYKLVHHYFEKSEDGQYTYGLSAATSPDGLHWERNPEPLFTDFKPFDAFNIVFWDDYLERYVAYVRRRIRRRFPKDKRFPSEPTALRYVGRAESEDFVHWTSPEVVVLGPDGQDPPEADYYGAGAFRYSDNAYFMMTPYFDHATDQVHLRLATSRENVTWRLAGNRTPFLPNGNPGSWDSMQIYSLVPAIVKDDLIHIYYLGLDAGHYGGVSKEEYRANAGIGLATLPLDGFISLQAGYLPGVVTTWPLRFLGSSLFLNAELVEVNEDTWPDHGIDVEVLDEEGYAIPEFSRHDCDTIRETGTDLPVQWNGKSDLSLLVGKPVKLRFYIQFARLYSMQFRKV